MNKAFKLSTLNILASIFCFVTHSYSIKNATTLIICFAIATISYIYLTITFIFKKDEVKPLIGTEV